MIELTKQLFRFGVVGGLATITNSVLFIFLVNSLKLWPLMSNFLAFLFSLGVSYIGHSWWTFRSKQHDKERLAKFLMTALMGLAINSGFVWIMMHYLGQSAYAATLPMIFITPVLTFFINKTWVFNQPIGDQPSLL